MPRNNKRKQIDKYKGPMVQGIDVSHHNSKVDFERVVADGNEFVFIRFGDGKDTDKLFKVHVANARKTRIRKGYYRYLRADRDGKAQAVLDLALLDSIGGFDHGDLTVACDIEHGIAKDLPGGEYDEDDLDLYGDIHPDLWATEALEYMAVMKEGLEKRGWGRILFIYTGQFFHYKLSQHPERRDLAEAFAAYPLWVPSYGTRNPIMPVDREDRGFPWAWWTIWQISGHGSIPGLPGEFDINLWRGTSADIDIMFPSKGA